MRLRTLQESGGLGFAVFIGMFLAYVTITVVYLEILRVTPPTEEVQELEDTPIAPEEAPFVPETPLAKGTVLDYSQPKDALVLLINTDISKLPEDTPQKFANYMSNTLPTVSEADDKGCVTAYTISKISNFNMSGSIGSADAKTGVSTDKCSKGLSVVWYLDETSWTWVSENFGVLPLCSELADLPIYSEFVEECVRDADEAVVDNPNGSIKNRES